MGTRTSKSSLMINIGVLPPVIVYQIPGVCVGGGACV